MSQPYYTIEALYMIITEMSRDYFPHLRMHNVIDASSAKYSLGTIAYSISQATYFSPTFSASHSNNSLAEHRNSLLLRLYGIDAISHSE